MEGWIQRALPDPEDAPRNLVYVIADSPAMHGGKRERLENQQIQRTLHHVRDFCQLCPLLSERKGSMALCSVVAQGRTRYYIGPPDRPPPAGPTICNSTRSTPLYANHTTSARHAYPNNAMADPCRGQLVISGRSDS